MFAVRSKPQAIVTYCIHPGYVGSRTDGDRHYIGFGQLCRLYGVPEARCVNAEVSGPAAANHAVSPALIHLAPRYDGDYSSFHPKPDLARMRAVHIKCVPDNAPNSEGAWHKIEISPEVVRGVSLHRFHDQAAFLKQYAPAGTHIVQIETESHR